ncbi:MAG: DUF6273 domain-containing protein, partial [Spirochaetaceae bacterium]|nr:DUF6273 domain-containing protein [Spirochaetaceae bacterium]
LLRLIVVGINSFNGLNDNDTPHVVFQFQNIPVKRRMNAEKTSVGGYRDSEMREYLVPFQSKEGSGKFLAGLINAGVPEDVLWVPLRCVYTGSSTEKISDPLWLPTGKEMFCDGFQYDEEEADNQAWLEYYESGDLVKYQNSSAAGVYWVATPYGKNKFFSVSRSGGEVDNPADSAYGVVPAFCVR